MGVSQQKQHITRQEPPPHSAPAPAPVAEPRGSPGSSLPKEKTLAERPLTQTAVSPSTDAHDDRSTIYGDDEDDTDRFEGSTSVAAHTAFASEFLENAVRHTSSLLPSEHNSSSPSNNGNANMDVSAGTGNPSFLSPFGNDSHPSPSQADNSYSARMESALGSLRHMVEVQNHRKKATAAAPPMLGGTESASKNSDGGQQQQQQQQQQQKQKQQQPMKSAGKEPRIKDLPLPPMGLVLDKLRELKRQFFFPPFLLVSLAHIRYFSSPSPIYAISPFHLLKPHLAKQ